MGAFYKVGKIKRALMLTTGLSIGLMVLAFVVTTLAYPYVLSFARKHKIVDNPNARKLQRVPVPVMGGTTVYIGVLVATIVGLIVSQNPRLLWALVLISIMYGVGVWDDLKDVSAYLRFLIEIGVVWIMILGLEVEINNFHGLWGVYDVPDVVSVPLTLIGGVGIMNAINLIDGVDGYCSSFGVVSCIAFAVLFLLLGEMALFALALVFIGALLPFFFHNVFGQKSKMFLGDGGSLMLGAVLSLFVFALLTSGRGNNVLDDKGLSRVALSLAILAVPIFDTLRVMMARIIRGLSPFHPDKTHLHHLFIEMDFSHLATSFMIVLGNLFIIGCLLLAWLLGASIDFQVYLVIGMALLFTTGFYYFMEAQRRANDGEGTALYKWHCKVGAKTHRSEKPFWRFMRKVVDSRFLGGPSPVVVSDSQTPSEEKPIRLDPRIR